MTIPQFFSTTRTAFVAAVTMILFAFFLPRSFGAFPIVTCSPPASAAGWCQNQNVWMGNLLAFFFWFSLVVIPVLSGILIAHVHRFVQPTFRQRTRQVLLAALIIVGLPAAVEILLLRPWMSVVGPTGIVYSPYALNAVFSTAAAVVPIASFIGGYGLYSFARMLRLRRSLSHKTFGSR